jgi:hypothetical protein
MLGTVTPINEKFINSKTGEAKVNQINLKNGEPLTLYHTEREGMENPPRRERVTKLKTLKDLPKPMQVIKLGENLSDYDTHLFVELLQKNVHAFSQDPYDLGRCNVFEASIRTGTSDPIYSPPYRLPIHLRDSLAKELQSMVERDMITPSKSPWASPMLYVPKGEGKMRLVVDFRKINKVSDPDVYPIPRIDDVLSSLKGATQFSSLDFNKGFWQIPLEEGSRDKSAFNTFHGQYEYKCLPQGLKQSPGNFMRCMNRIFGDMQWKKCLIYIDDLLIFCKSVEEHIEILQEIFDRCRAANLKLNPEKTFMGRPSIVYLGHHISAEGVAPLRERIEAIDTFPAPTKVKEVQRFLGMCAYYGKFIKAFSSIASPLYKFKDPKAKFVWTEECENAFKTLKKALTESPVLIHPDMKKPFILHTDASNDGLGAVLSQLGEDEKEHPIAYAARTLKSSERNYVTHDLECLAIKFGIEHFRHFLYGGPKFQVVTDHIAFRWLMTAPPKNSRIARWRLEFDEYDFDIKHRPGKENANADVLSRNPRFAEIAGPRSLSMITEKLAATPLTDITEGEEIIQAIDETLKKAPARQRSFINAIMKRRFSPSDYYVQSMVQQTSTDNVSDSTRTKSRKSGPIDLEEDKAEKSIPSTSQESQGEDKGDESPELGLPNTLSQTFSPLPSLTQWPRALSSITEEGDVYSPIRELATQMTLNSDSASPLRERKEQVMNAKATENGPEILEEIESTPLRGGLWENLKPLQKADKFFGPLIEYIETDVLPTDYNKAIKVAAAAPEFVMDNDLLFRIDSNREDTKMQLAVPQPLRNHAMIACHESLCTGHAGQQKHIVEWHNSIGGHLFGIRLKHGF